MRTPYTPITYQEEQELIERLNCNVSTTHTTGSIIIHGDPSALHVAHTAMIANTLCNTEGGHIYVDEYSFCGQESAFLTGEHPIELKMAKRRNTLIRNKGTIIIGKGVWIASRAIIIGPCRIGDHAVIAAGSVVLPGDYEGGCLYAGNPAVFKKRIEFAEDTE
jgi:acetyltransferase-like isoleucine patch superfamily enzyme